MPDVLADAVAHLQAGRLPQAEASARQVLAATPRWLEAWHVLGLALAGQRRFAEALAAFQQVAAIDPNVAEAHVNIGQALSELGRLTEAQAAFERALQVRPRFALAASNLGNVLKAQGQTPEAIAKFRQALEFQPDFAPAANNLGMAWLDLGRPDLAIDAYQAAIRMQPQLAEAHYNLALALREIGRLDEAVATYRRALEIRPNDADTYNNLGNALTVQGRLDEAVEHYRRALSLSQDFTTAYSNLLFCLNYQPDLDPADLLEEHRRWANWIKRFVPSIAWGVTYLPADAQLSDRRSADSPRAEVIEGDLRPVHSEGSGYLCRTSAAPIRIGYVSADFARHPVTAFLEPVVEHHDRRRFEVALYSDVRRPDAVTERFRNLANLWRDTSRLSAAELAQQVRSDGIDILIDLAGHTRGNRLRAFAEQPAPIQLTWLGYPHSTGLETIQYRLTDAVLDPPDAPYSGTERPLRLVPGFCCFRPADDAPPVAPLPAQATGRVTFGALHNLAKLNAHVLDLWSRLLVALPGSRLVIGRDTLKGSAREHYQSEFARRGLGPDRVELRYVDRNAGQHHLAAYDEIDIALDVFPWCGHTTACEALWQGVPVVTLSGNRAAGRMVESVLNMVGCPQWTAKTPERYLEIATELASDLAALARHRATIRPTMAQSPLCDAATFTRHLEAALAAIQSADTFSNVSDVNRQV